MNNNISLMSIGIFNCKLAILSVSVLFRDFERKNMYTLKHVSKPFHPKMHQVKVNNRPIT